MVALSFSSSRTSGRVPSTEPSPSCSMPMPSQKPMRSSFLPLHEPDLEEVLSDGVAGLELEGFVHPGDLINDGFFFDKDRTELTICSEAGDGSFVESAVVFPDPLEHVRDEGGIDGLVDFV